MSASGLTRLIDRLERDGLVQRSACPTDRRGAFAVLTDDGLAVITNSLDVHLAAITASFTGLLSPDELEDLLRSLRIVRDVVRPGAAAGTVAGGSCEDEPRDSRACAPCCPTPRPTSTPRPGCWASGARAPRVVPGCCSTWSRRSTGPRPRRGRSGGLGSPADRQVFHALRAHRRRLAGRRPGTVRAEHYGPPRVTPELQQWRRSAGRPHSPGWPWCRAASARPGRSLLHRGRGAPLGHHRRGRADRAPRRHPRGGRGGHRGRGPRRPRQRGRPAPRPRGVHRAGRGRSHAQRPAHRRRSLDEVCLTLSPALVGGASNRVRGRRGGGGFTPLRLDRVLADGDHLFLRYVRAGAA